MKHTLQHLVTLIALGAAEECWLWQGRCNRGGYGKYFYEGRYHMAHRLVWQLRHGTVPPSSQCVCHTCDTPRCCNPDHLWLGTNAENVADRVRKGREGDRGGIRNGRAKVTPQMVAAIREAPARWGVVSALSRTYGIGRTQVRRIRDGESWPDAGVTA